MMAHAMRQAGKHIGNLAIKHTHRVAFYQQVFHIKAANQSIGFRIREAFNGFPSG